MSGKTRQQQSNAQLGLSLDGARPVEPEPSAGVPERFIAGAGGEFFIGAQRLDQYLKQHQQGWVVRLRRLLSELDYSPFVAGYRSTGRRPLHPRVLLGLIVYGMVRGEWSLRALERLALVDLGAWWITGRLQPDHSTIGKFIQLHQELLSEEFFAALVKHLVGKLALSPGTVAVDGTVIEAVASRYRMLKAEALREAGLSAQAEQILAQRQAARQFKGGDGASTRLVAGEPQAAVQPTKQGLWRPSYKPSAMRHESGLVVAQAVHPSSESAVVRALLEQHLAVFAAEPVRLLGDAAYGGLELLRELCGRNIDALVAVGKAAKTDQPWIKRSPKGRLSKAAFRYDPQRDLYHCPGQRTLVRQQRSRDGRGRQYVRYRGQDCEGCALRPSCTKARRGRSLKRYAGDEYKEAMAQVLSQPAARRQWRRRSGLIEPLFAELRQRQRLTRFHRRGLEQVRVEFALHCLAFNLRLVLAGRPWLGLFILWWRLPGGGWRLAGCAWALFPWSA